MSHTKMFINKLVVFFDIKIAPEEGSDRCKVVIEGCKTQTMYKVAVAAVPKSMRSTVTASKDVLFRLFIILVS